MVGDRTLEEAKQWLIQRGYTPNNNLGRILYERMSGDQIPSAEIKPLMRDMAAVILVGICFHDE